MGHPKKLVTAFQFRANQPQVVHVLPAHGPEASDDAARGTLSLGGSPARAGTHDGLSEFSSGVVVTLSDVAHRAALADGFINGSASAATQSAQRETIRATRIRNWTAAWAAGSASHPALITQRSIGSHGSAIKPRLVVVLAGLHVKAHSHKSWFAQRIGSRPSTVAAAKVARDTFVREDENRAVVITVAIPIVIAIAALILRSCKCSQRDEKQNCTHSHYSHSRTTSFAVQT